jgi:hypothetical protein
MWIKKGLLPFGIEGRQTRGNGRREGGKRKSRGKEWREMRGGGRESSLTETGEREDGV